MGFFDLFKPQWKHSNPSVRAAAVRHLHDEQQEIFLGIALEDADAANRLAAARRLHDPVSLRRLRDRSQDRNLRDLAQRVLVEKLAREIIAAEDGAEALAKANESLDEIGDEGRFMEDIATEAKSYQVRHLALDRLIHPSSLLKVAQNESDPELSLAAFQRITRENHLESLAKQAKNREVRQLAKDKLKEIEKSKLPDEAAVNKQKLVLLFNVAEKAASAVSEPPANFPWEVVNEQVQEAEDGLQQLLSHGVIPPQQSLSQFRDRVAMFREKFQAFHREEQSKREKLEKDRQAAAVKEGLCLEIESLGRSENEDGSLSAALRQKFEAAGSAGEFEEELNRRFRQAWDNHERFRISQAREREDQDRRQQREEDAKTRLQSLAAEASSLLAIVARETQAPAAKGSEGAMAGAAEKLRDLKRDWTKFFAASLDFEGRAALGEAFEKDVEEMQAAMETLRAQNLARMRELLPEMETLAESLDFSQAERRFRELTGAWKSLQPLPQGEEADGLITAWRIAADHFREAQDWLRWSNLRSKQEVCQKLEELAEGEVGKAMFAGFKDLQGQWKSFGPVPWDASEALWDRYHQICDKLYEKLKEYFAELDEERESHLKAKEEICARLESLVQGGELDWRDGTEAVKEAQAAWKDIGAVPKEKAEALWQRFKAATNAFFDRKDGWLGENLHKKIELAALAESLQDSTDWKATSAAIKEAQEKWKIVGPVPRSETEAIWLRFHTACEKFFSARRAYFDKLETERPLNAARKLELCVLVETLEDLPTDQERYQRIVEAQAAWKEVGPVPREEEEPLWERFRKPIDAYFQGRKARMEEEYQKRDENARLKEELCAQAEAVADSTDWKPTIERMKELQAQWRAIGPAPRDKDKELWTRFRSACDGFFDRLKQNAQKRDAEREMNLRRKEDICFLVEGLAGLPLGEGDEKEPGFQNGDGAENATGGSANDASPSDRDWKTATEEVKNLQRQWKQIGPVPKEKSELIWDRFHLACDTFFEGRRRALGLQEEDPQVNLENKLSLIDEAEKLSANPGEHQVQAVIQLRRNWKRIGPVPRAQSDYVWKRFNAACEQAAGSVGGEGQGSYDPSQAEPAESV